MQEENLNLVAGTNIELVRTGNDVYVNNTYDYDPTEIEAEVGDLSQLTTTVKTDLVSAINEVNGLIGDIDEALDLINGEVVN